MKLGKAFADAVIIEQKTARRFTPPQTPSWWLGAGRALIFTTILFVALFVLLWRLFDLTLIQGHQLRGLAEGNRTRELIRHAPRGRILDRTGKVLAENVPQYRLILPCPKGESRACTKLLDQSQRDAVLLQGLPEGEYIENDYGRRYSDGSANFHIVGYTGEISEIELRDPYFQLRGYHPGDRLGRMGAEAVFEERLRGKDGKELVEINSSGKITRTLGRVEEIPGEDIELSVDRGLALAAENAFPPGQKGAVIVSRPATGEVLALYSSPSLDTNIFTQSISQNNYDALIKSPDQPMFNRGIGGVYPPGSTFKMIIAIAGLEEGTITDKTLIEDVGVLKIGPYSFPNWYFIQYGKTDGLVDIVKALQRSNDIFFYKAGEAIGITKLGTWAKRLGIGTALGIELPGEAIGLMPDPAWKATRFDTPADKEARNDQWYLGDTYHVSIGQGYLLVTPLQVNAWTNTIANGGKLCKPTIEKKRQKTRDMKQECKNLNIKKETINLITAGMKKACEPGGTGWPLFNFGVKKIKVSADQSISASSKEATSSDALTPPDALTLTIPLACKTGTAEFGDPQNHTHAWFTAFAPLPDSTVGVIDNRKTSSADSNKTIVGDPEISVTVLVEGAGEGSDKAAPIAKKILEEWFGR